MDLALENDRGAILSLALGRAAARAPGRRSRASRTDNGTGR